MTLNLALDLAAAQASDQMYSSGQNLSYGQNLSFEENGGRIGLGIGAELEAGLKYGGTQNYQLQPKYLTQKVMKKPKIITETEIRPVYQRTINRPSILRERYIQVPNMLQSQARM